MTGELDDESPFSRDRRIAGFGVFWPAATIWAIVALTKGCAEVSEADKNFGFLDRFIGDKPNPAGVFFGWVFSFAFGVLIIAILAYCLGYAFALWNRNRRDTQMRRQEDSNAEAVLQESRRLAISQAEALRSEQLARSNEAIIRSLGSLDQYVRVLEHESLPERRVMALQSAQNVVTGLVSRLASGDILPSALEGPIATGMAMQTCRELERIGLQEDRLVADLRRVFSLVSLAQRTACDQTADPQATS